jgi:copper chaperone CopZ
VTGELEALDGVTSVTISLVPQGNSTLTVTSSAQLARDAVREAIERAGYELIDAP